MWPAVHAQRSPDQTRPPPHDHKENSLLAGWRQEFEQNGHRKNPSLEVWHCSAKHAGTCWLKLSNEQPATRPTPKIPEGHTGSSQAHGTAVLLNHGNEKEIMHWTLFLLYCSFVHIFSKRFFVYIIVIICMHSCQSLCMKFCLIHFTFCTSLFVLIFMYVYVNVLFVVLWNEFVTFWGDGWKEMYIWIVIISTIIIPWLYLPVYLFILFNTYL